MCDSETTSGDIQAKSVQDRSHRTLTERITRTKKPGSVTPLGTALAFLVSAVLSLTLAVACLVPLHVSHTRAVPLPPLIDARTFELDVPEAFQYAKGDKIPLYRFHGGFQSELGRARVVAAADNRLILELVPETLIYPPGRQGRILGGPPGALQMDFGPDPTFVEGDVLNVFEDYQPVARVRLEHPPRGGPLRGRMLTYNERGRTLLARGADSFSGLAVSEYTILSTVSLFSNEGRVVALEIGVLGLVLLLEIVLFARYRIGLLAFIGRATVAAVRRCPHRLKTGLSLVCWLLLSLPVSWFTGEFVVALVRRVKAFEALGRHVPPEAAWAISAFVLNAWLLLALWRSEPLPLWVWRKLAYRPPRPLVRLGRHPHVYRSIVWLLHLPVFYAFAFALVGFLAADINVALTFLIPDDTKLSLPGATLSQPETLVTWLQATRWNLGVLSRTGPAALTFEQATAVIRFLIYAGAITGCMIGYLHSVLKVLWWSSIRNVDFTILGWLTAMLCYAPLLGHVLWSIIEFPVSLVPAVTQGPLFYAMLVLELLLNVLYTLSLYNMFTKFGVLVDKGLVDTGFYSFLRHPSYTLEAFMLILVYARMLQTGATWFGILVLVLLYWLRSEREDVFMAGSNPEYPEYRRRVTCKFVPGLG